MKNLKYIKYASVLAFAVLMIACDSDYTKMVKTELSKGERQDSLLLGVRFGNTREEFYGRCFDLNKQQIVTQGEGFSVQYIIKDSTRSHPHNITLYFYPTFDSLNIIQGMDMEFFYPGWAMGSRELQSDSLRERVVSLLSEWYRGNDFKTIKINDERVPVKIDANRRIMVHIEDQQRVLVHVQDLLHPDYRHKAVAVNEALERKKR